jgi:hypothetical protein
MWVNAANLSLAMPFIAYPMYLYPGSIRGNNRCFSDYPNSVPETSEIFEVAMAETQVEKTAREIEQRWRFYYENAETPRDRFWPRYYALSRSVFKKSLPV